MVIQQQSTFELARDIVKAKNIQHIAIIMDGNRRWAVQNNLLKTVGHDQGRKTFKAIVKHSAKLGLKYLTTYAFSTENWGRNPDEVNFLMKMFISSLKDEIQELKDNNVRLKFIGRRDRLDKNIVKMMEQSEIDTRDNTALTLQMAIDYGSRTEITDAIKKIALDINNNKISVDQVNEELVGSYLYTSEVPDPDLIIRTGGEYRLSNYLMWQAAYSELFITDVFWPEFVEEELEKSIIDFNKRQRRWGKD
ncbi:MAG: polyprenyl diphosphate synthase [Vampirovibrionia bacterium]